MRSSARIGPNSNITPEQARELRAKALRYALDRYFEKPKAAGTASTDGEEAKGSQHEVRPADIIRK